MFPQMPLPEGAALGGLVVPVGEGDLEIKGQDNCDRLPTVKPCLGAGLFDIGSK